MDANTYTLLILALCALEDAPKSDSSKEMVILRSCARADLGI